MYGIIKHHDCHKGLPTQIWILFVSSHKYLVTRCNHHKIVDGTNLQPYYKSVIENIEWTILLYRNKTCSRSFLTEFK